MLKEHPNSTLYDAAKLLIQTHARRLPLLDYDTETGHELIVSVLTQYRLLKFISINVFDSFHFTPLDSPHCFTSVPEKYNISTFPSANSRSEHMSRRTFHQRFHPRVILIGR